MKKRYIQPTLRVVYLDVEQSVLIPASNPVQSQSLGIGLESTDDEDLWGSTGSNDDYFDWGN